MSLILVVLFLHTPGMVPMMQTTPVQQWSMGFYTPLNGPGPGPVLPPDAIEWGGVTHVIYIGGNVHSDGTLDITTYKIPTKAPILISNAHANGVKVMLGLMQCDWCSGYSSTQIQSAVTNNLSGLVTNVMSVVNSYGFDGVDVDWEYTNGSLHTLENNLLSALRTALGSKILTAEAIYGDADNWVNGIQYLDRLNLMTYDLIAPSYGKAYSWFNAALYGDPGGGSNTESVNDMATEYMALFPAAKLNIGIPFYGWADTNLTGPRQTAGWSTSTGKQYYYHDLGTAGFNLNNYTWDASAQVPWLYQHNLWVTYDNAQSVAAKVNYAKSKGLGGWIIWELVGDYFPTQTPTQPLLDAIKNAIRPTALSSCAPGIFEVSPGVVAAQDTSFHGIGPSNPAMRGQTIALYANCLGPVTNPPATGQVALSSPLSETISTPTVTIGGQQAAVSFSGLSPYWSALYQINVVVPQNLSPGNYRITVSIGGQTSNTSGIIVQ